MPSEIFNKITVEGFVDEDWCATYGIDAKSCGG
jgi:hypothetical protein